MSNDRYETKLAVNQGKRSSTKKNVSTTPTTAKKKVATFRKPKPVAKTILFGALSACAYGLIFSSESLVTNLYTLGGWHSVFPVGTAFAFSFIHGAFASNLISVCGLEPKKA